MEFIEITSTTFRPRPQEKLQEFTSVWLRRNNEKEHIFYCNTCQCPLFKYQGSVAMMVPGNVNNNDEGEMVMQFPLIIPCRGHSPKYGKCPAVYVIEGFVI